MGKEVYEDRARFMANETIRKRMTDVAKRLKKKGFSNSDIAETLGLTEGTIRTFLKES